MDRVSEEATGENSLCRIISLLGFSHYFHGFNCFHKAKLCVTLYTAETYWLVSRIPEA